MVLQSGIDKPSVVLKSSFKTKNQHLGYSAEQAVVILLQKRNWILEFQRLKTKFAEIDLVFSKEDKVLLLEVKKLNDPWRSFERINLKQYQKLQSNLLFFSSMFKNFEFEAYVVWVDPMNKVSFARVN